MTPYYQDDSITIYHGDCRTIMPSIGPIDLVLTDPPYGIADIWSGGSKYHGWTKANTEGKLRNQWDVKVSNDLLYAITQISKKSIIWGGNYYNLPESRGWLVWNKPERGFSLAEAELAWTNLDMVVRVFDWHRSDQGRVHPTQKPLALMKWCLGWVPNAQVILDPFMGSGTTLLAAKNLGRRAIGIEIEEDYCRKAVDRIKNDLSLFSYGNQVEHEEFNGFFHYENGE